mmetsp:Transcript_12021/g.18580  ORF Transcript_12021/g.18580 Transcript_12021/m.18580 type:complete len:103 (+) Transcript_12021:1739-2047(+)
MIYTYPRKCEKADRISPFVLFELYEFHVPCFQATIFIYCLLDLSPGWGCTDDSDDFDKENSASPSTRNQTNFRDILYNTNLSNYQYFLSPFISIHRCTCSIF